MKAFTLLLFFCATASLASSWAQHEVNLRGYVYKIRTLEEERDKLIKEKSATRDNAKVQEIIQQLTDVHKHIEKLYDEFGKEKEHIRFEHPEQGANIERKYRRYHLKSVEERENEMGLQGKLNAVKEDVGRAYRKSAPTTKKK